NEAHRLHPDMPALDLLKGVAFNLQEQWADGLKHLEAYQALLGEDDVLCYELGRALHGLTRHQEAARAYRKSLDDNPKSAQACLGLVRVLTPQDDRRDFAERFAKLDQRHTNFDTFARDCWQARDGAGLEQLALAMRKLEPDFVPAMHYLAVARAWNRRL